MKNTLRQWAEERAEERERAQQAAHFLIGPFLEMPVRLGLEYIQDNPPSALTIEILIELAVAKGATKASRKGADARAAKTIAAKEWVQATWTAEGHEYKRGKADFARIYSRKLLREKVKITERQIATEWLKGL